MALGSRKTAPAPNLEMPQPEPSSEQKATRTKSGPVLDVSLDQQPPAEAEAIRDRLRDHEGKQEGKLARANPQFGKGTGAT